jgi:hypothetical protein
VVILAAFTASLQTTSKFDEEVEQGWKEVEQGIRRGEIAGEEDGP